MVKCLNFLSGLQNSTNCLGDFSDTSRWSAVEAEGTAPGPRDKLQAVAMGHRLYFFGGFGPKSTDMDDDDDEEVSDSNSQFDS